MEKTTTTRSAAVLIVDGQDEKADSASKLEERRGAIKTTAPPPPALKKKAASSSKAVAVPATPASTTGDKSVRFVLTAKDGSTRVIRFPGGVLRSVKIGKIPVYPLPVVLGLMETQRFAHLTSATRRRAWSALSSALLAVSALLLGVALAMLLVYLHLRPRIPHLMIKDYNMGLDVIAIDLHRSGLYFSYELDFDAEFFIDYHNVNARVDIHNEYVESTVFYRGTPVGKAIVRQFVVPRATRLDILVHVELTTTPLELNVGYTLIRDIENFEMVCELVVKARMTTVGRLKSPLVWLRVRCFILLLHYQIMSQNCRNFNF